MSVAVGQPAPQFSLLDQDKNPVSNQDLKGNKTLLIFLPFAFSGTCSGELCEIRDRTDHLNDLEANVVAITCDSFFANKQWAEHNGLDFKILADFWPHGETARAFGVFNEDVGVANRYTFVLDDEGVVREVINTDSLGEAREFDRYTDALAAI